MQNICFVSNFSKTYLFDVIGKQLIKEGINVFWIVTNKKLYDFLIASYLPQNILYINRSYVNKHNDAISDFKLHELLYGDRVLRYELKNGELFLMNIQMPIYNFLTLNNIKFVFGEITWAHEVLINRICGFINIKYLEPQVVRIPNNRFAFFAGESQNELFSNSQSTITDTDIFQVIKPNYLKINDTILARDKSILGRFLKVKRYFNNIIMREHESDPTVSASWHRFKARVQEESNKEMYRFIHTMPIDTVRQEKYVLMTLHVQPENSIDIYGRYYENQLSNIINIWRKLPIGWKLVVKEHSNAIGNRTYKFYSFLKKLPNLIIVNEKINSIELIDKAQLVISVTGTIAYEAALMKKPAIVFAPVYFTKLNYCSVKTLADIHNCDTINDWIIEINEREDNRQIFCLGILRNSFEGNFTDPLSDASVLEENNINLLTQAFIRVIKQLNS